MLAIPVRHHGEIVAVLARETSTRNTKMLGELERTYVAIFERFAVMVAEGSFPSEGPLEDSSAAPRIGDGTILLDEDARVRYASPNAMSVFHRVGITANALGMRLTEMGFNDSSARRALDTGRPVIEEFDQTSDITLLSRCIPIMAGGRGDRRAAAGARRHRGAQARQVAAVEGRHHPRSAPPGEEQPADHLVVAAVAGPPVAVGRGQGRGERVGAAHPHDRRGARDAVTRGRRRRVVHRHRPAVAPPVGGGPAVAGPADPLHRARRRRPLAHHRGHAAVGRADRTAAERRSTTASPRAAPVATWWCSSTAPRVCCRSRS